MTSFARILAAAAVLMAGGGMASTTGAMAQTASPNAYENGVLTDPAAKTLCLAMGRSFTTRAAKIDDKLKTFDETFPSPDAGEKQIRDTMKSLQGQFSQLGSALQDLYSDADAPSEAEQTTVDAMSASDLLSASGKCTQ